MLTVGAAYFRKSSLSVSVLSFKNAATNRIYGNNCMSLKFKLACKFDLSRGGVFYLAVQRKILKFIVTKFQI